MTMECKVVYGCGTYVAGPIAGKRATCTESAEAAARALGRKILGGDFADAQLCGRAGTGVFYRLTSKSDAPACDGVDDAQQR